MLVAGKQSPIPKRTTSTSSHQQQQQQQNRVGLTSVVRGTSSIRPVVTIKTPQASPGNRSAQTTTTSTTTVVAPTTATTVNNNTTAVCTTAIHRRPLITPQATHASRALASARAAQRQGPQQQQSVLPSAVRNSHNLDPTTATATATTAARSGSATARSGSATARSASVKSQHADPTVVSSSSCSPSTQPFHRPNLASLHHSQMASKVAATATKTGGGGGGGGVPLTRMANATSTSSATSSVGAGAGAGTTNKRSSSTASVGNTGVARSGSALGGNTRTPSPVAIRPKRCKHCSALVADLDKHSLECPCSPIECALSDSEDPKTICGFVARGHKHLEQHQASDCAFRLVECRNADSGCTDQVSHASMDRHVHNSCLFAVMMCEFCKHPVTRGHYEAHVATDCPGVKVLCPLGCGRDILRSDLTQHIREQWADPAHPRRPGGSKHVATGDDSGSSSGVVAFSSSSLSTKMPPESARRVAETLLSCLEVVTQQKETETILAPSDEIDVHPIGGDVNSLEHALFVGQCVLRSIARLEKYYTDGKKASTSRIGYSPQLAQSVFELVERRTEAAKQRLKNFSERSEAAVALHRNLETTLGRVALEVASTGEE